MRRISTDAGQVSRLHIVNSVASSSVPSRTRFRKMMWIGAFYTLLVNGSTWIPGILDSFEQIGQGASGLGAPISPSGVFELPHPKKRAHP